MVKAQRLEGGVDANDGGGEVKDRIEPPDLVKEMVEFTRSLLLVHFL